MSRRWDSDQRGYGVGDAAQLVPGARELVAAFGQSDWVAEQPEIHLRPHVEVWCQRDPRLALVAKNNNDGLAYALDLENGAARSAVWEKRGPLSSPSSDPSPRVRLMSASAV